jgi:peptide/nickel transport system permease protein
MRTYAIRRALINIPVVLFVISMVFFATSVLPGDFVAERIAQQNPISDNPELQKQQIQAVRHDLGLDKPVAERYVIYMTDLFQGDFGISFETRRSAISGFRDGLPPTLQLSLMTLFVSIVTSVPIGIISAIRQDSWVDYILRIFAISSLAAPNFWVATMLLLYVVRWGLWTVPITDSPLLWEDPIGSLKLYSIPAVAGGLASGAGVMRLLRSQMLEVLRQDYIRTAWSKGMRERTVIVRHALKNALIPVVTVLGLTIATLLSGNVVFEFLFNINGIGNRILKAIRARDVPVVQAFIVIIATFVVFVNLAIDLLYGMLDPRIRYS